jgi:hypothetical protein
MRQSDVLFNEMKQCFKQINEIGESNYKLIDSYPLIRELATALKNILKTSETLKTLLDLKEEIEKIDELLMEEDEAYGLSEAHSRILGLEKIRDDILLDVQSGEVTFDTHFEVFEDYFKKIDDVSERFRKLIWTIMEDIEARAESDPVTIVHIVSIIVKEEERDADKRRQLELKNITDGDTDEISYDDMSTDLSTVKSTRSTDSTRDRSNSDARAAKLRKKSPRIQNHVRFGNYKQQMFEVLANSIKYKFTEGLDDASSMDEKIELLTNYFEEDLCRNVLRNVVPCFPEEFDIWNFYVRTYEGELEELVKRMINTKDKKHLETPLGEKLKFIEFLNKYHELVADTIQNPRNFTKEGEIMIGDFISNRSTFMIQVAQNTVQQDFGPDLKESIKLSANKRGYPCTPAPTEIFTMINSQVDEIYKNKIDRLIPLLGENCRGTLRLFITETLRQIQQRLPELNLVTLCAFANNCTRAKFFTKDLSNRMLHLYEERHIPESFDTYEKVVEDFQKLGEKCVEYACDLIAKDLDPLFAALFQKDWIKYQDTHVSGRIDDNDSDSEEEKNSSQESLLAQSIISKVVKKLTKYFQENLEQNLLEDEWLTMLTEKVATYCVNKYLDYLLHPDYKVPKFDKPKLAMRQMKFDIRTLKQFFSDPVEIVEGGGESDEEEKSSDSERSDNESESDDDSGSDKEKSKDKALKLDDESDEENSLQDPSPRVIQRNRLSLAQIKTIFRPLELVLKLFICHDPDDITLALAEITQEFPDISPSVIHRIFKMRTDIAKTEMKAISDVITNHFERHAERNIKSFSLFAKYDSGMKKKMIEATSVKSERKGWFKFGRKRAGAQIRPTENQPNPSVVQPKIVIESAPSTPAVSKKKEPVQYETTSLDDFLAE